MKKQKFSPEGFQSKGWVRGTMSEAAGCRGGTAEGAGTPAAGTLEMSTGMKQSSMHQSQQPRKGSWQRTC